MRIYANRDFTDKTNEYGPWTMHGVLGTDLVLEYDPTTREWVGEIPESYKYYLFLNETTEMWWEWSRYEWIEDHWEYSGAGTYEATQDATEITLDGYTTTRQPPVSNGVLALVSDIPTKTSELTNDSGFITSAQVPTPDKIEDLSSNIIYANRTAQYIEEVANWTDEYWPDFPLNLDADNNYWRADPSPSFYMTLKYNSGTWTLEFNENIGGEWVVDSASV